MSAKYLKQTIETYLRSFTKVRLLGIVFFLNILFGLFAYLGFQITRFILKNPFGKMNSVDLEGIALKSASELAQITSTLRTFFIAIIIAAVLFFLFLLVSFSCFQGIAWCTILKKKFTMKYMRRFTLLNLIWLSTFSILFFVFLLSAKEDMTVIALSALILVFSYFSLFLFFFFTKRNNISGIRKALKIGTTKIHYFLIPMLLISITCYIISQISILYRGLSFGIVFNLLLLLLLFSWVKIYISDTVIKIK